MRTWMSLAVLAALLLQTGCQEESGGGGFFSSYFTGVLGSTISNIGSGFTDFGSTVAGTFRQSGLVSLTPLITIIVNLLQTIVRMLEPLFNLLAAIVRGLAYLVNIISFRPASNLEAREIED